MGISLLHTTASYEDQVFIEVLSWILAVYKLLYLQLMRTITKTLEPRKIIAKFDILRPQHMTHFPP